jgi:hypothetical protein
MNRSIIVDIVLMKIKFIDILNIEFIFFNVFSVYKAMLFSKNYKVLNFKNESGQCLNL